MAQPFSYVTMSSRQALLQASKPIMDNAGLDSWKDHHSACVKSRPRYYNYLWKCCGHVPILPLMMPTTHRACNSIKGACGPTKLDSVYTRYINELS